MEISELLKPRYLVIADYPGSPNLGTIFSQQNKVLPTLFYDEDNCDFFEEGILKKYPNIFKLLQWWEHRDVSEMPEYIKRVRYQGNSNTKIKIDDIIKVQWSMESPKLEGFESLKMICFKSDDDWRYWYDENCFIPCTLTDYTTQTPTSKQ